ncbi:MAG: hypothetical protein GY820_04600 [Gammaproteobacteria bacterium]|nr:hypothetical protein [Gammaproteobacteria bacterium]
MLDYAKNKIRAYYGNDIAQNSMMIMVYENHLTGEIIELKNDKKIGEIDTYNASIHIDITTPKRNEELIQRIKKHSENIENIKQFDDSGYAITTKDLYSLYKENKNIRKYHSKSLLLPTKKRQDLNTCSEEIHKIYRQMKPDIIKNKRKLVSMTMSNRPSWLALSSLKCDNPTQFSSACFSKIFSR